MGCRPPSDAVSANSSAHDVQLGQRVRCSEPEIARTVVEACALGTLGVEDQRAVAVVGAGGHCTGGTDVTRNLQPPAIVHNQAPNLQGIRHGRNTLERRERGVARFVRGVVGVTNFYCQRPRFAVENVGAEIKLGAEQPVLHSDCGRSSVLTIEYQRPAHR